MQSYLKNIGIGLSITWNAIWGGRRYETFSAVQYEMHLDGVINIAWLIDFFLGEDHCFECWIIQETINEVLREIENDRCNFN